MRVGASPDILLVRRAATDRAVLRRNRVKGRQGPRLRRARPLDAVEAVIRYRQGTGGAATAADIARDARRKPPRTRDPPVPCPAASDPWAAAWCRSGGVIVGALSLVRFLDDNARADLMGVPLRVALYSATPNRARGGRSRPFG